MIEIVIRRPALPRRASIPSRKWRLRAAHVNPSPVRISVRIPATTPATIPRTPHRPGSLRLLELLHRVITLRDIQFPTPPQILPIRSLRLIHRRPRRPTRITLRPSSRPNRPRPGLRKRHARATQRNKRAHRATRPTIPPKPNHASNSPQNSNSFQNVRPATAAPPRTFGVRWLCHRF
jgi:hypothetical protein